MFLLTNPSETNFYWYLNFPDNFTSPSVAAAASLHTPVVKTIGERPGEYDTRTCSMRREIEVATAAVTWLVGTANTPCCHSDGLPQHALIIDKGADQPSGLKLEASLCGSTTPAIKMCTVMSWLTGWLERPPYRVCSSWISRTS